MAVPATSDSMNFGRVVGLCSSIPAGEAVDRGRRDHVMQKVGDATVRP